MLGSRRINNPYKGPQSILPDGKLSQRSKRLAVSLLLLLVFLFFLYKWFNVDELKEIEDIQVEPPPPVTLEKPRLKKEVWTALNQYDVIKGICYLDYELSHVNNRRADHDSCFAACLGYNQEHATNLCIGWTSARSSVSGTETCILRSRLDEETKVHSESCISARMWASAIKPGKDKDKHSVEGAEKGKGKHEHAPINREDLPERKELCGASPFTKKRPLRVFIACMQASGCTLLSYLLGQKNNTAVILDMGVRQNIPKRAYFAKANHAYPEVDTIVLKASVRSYASKDPLRWLERVREMFNPDYSLLFMRHPVDAFLHLATHVGGDFPGGLPDDSYSNCNAKASAEFSYGLRCGTPVSKLKALNRLFVKREGRFNRVVTYEDLCLSRESFVKEMREDGVCLTESSVHRPQKSIMEIMQFAFRYFPSVHQNRDVPPTAIFWGAGHLANTFHTIEGDPVPGDKAYRLCLIDQVKEKRNKLLQKTGSPYKEKSMKKIEKIVKNAAPDIWAFYESEQRFRDIFANTLADEQDEVGDIQEAEGEADETKEKHGKHAAVMDEEEKEAGEEKETGKQKPEKQIVDVGVEDSQSPVEKSGGRKSELNESTGGQKDDTAATVASKEESQSKKDSDGISSNSENATDG